MKLKVKRLSEKAVMPTKAHPTDAGFDLTATSVELDDFHNIVYHTDIAFEIPEGYVGLLFPRSSNAKKDLILSNSVGVIDCHYRGEVTMKFKTTERISMTESDGKNVEFGYCYEFGGAIFNRKIKNYKAGDRIGQLVIVELPQFDIEEADTLSETDRGNGGYGSTGN